jgi:hypothetical protein
MLKGRHQILTLVIAVFLTGIAHAQGSAAYDIDLRTILTHDDGKFLWFHPRAAVIPDSGGRVVMTLQKHLHKSDFYSGVYVMESDDFGETWTDPELPEALDWRMESEDVAVAVCDVTPGWHAPTKKLLALGAKVRYRDGKQLYDVPQSRAGAYSAFDPETDAWQEWKFLDVPDPEGAFFLVTVGCAQWLVEEDGTVLVPIYFRDKDAQQNKVTVVRYAFDGTTMTYIEHGDDLELPVTRGLVEPSLAKLGDHYYMTLRNDEKGYVTRGTDGLHWDAIQPWTFEDGEELGSYNTQQHWVTRGDKLFLVYTRRGADNDHIMRHRAPLFMARVDRESLHVMRNTERVVIPERGATLGNFGVCQLGPGESWVTVSEGVWNDEARKRGATGATYIARIQWNDNAHADGEQAE